MTVTIGVGNCKGGVGSSTLVCQLAAMLRAMGHTVAIAESDKLGAVIAWAEARAERAGRQLNTSRLDIGAYYIDDYADLRIAPQLVGYDYIFIDYRHARDDIKQAVRVTDHWICPMRPTDWAGTVAAYERWCELHRGGSVAARNFSVLLTMVQSVEQYEEEWRAEQESSADGHAAPNDANDIYWDDFGRSLATGDYARQQLAVEAPSLHLLDVVIGDHPVAWNLADGADVFRLQTPENAAAARDLVTVWTEAVKAWREGAGTEVPPLPFGMLPIPTRHRIETLGRYWRS